MSLRGKVKQVLLRYDHLAKYGGFGGSCGSQSVEMREQSKLRSGSESHSSQECSVALVESRPSTHLGEADESFDIEELRDARLHSRVCVRAEEVYSIIWGIS